MIKVEFKGKNGADVSSMFTAEDVGEVAREVFPQYPADRAEAWMTSIVEVECARAGYLPDGRLAILFEAHWFDRFTEGRHRESHPNISSRSWNRSLYWGGAAEYRRLETAMALDAGAAIKSASYGFPQIMGFNYHLCGYANAESMITHFANCAPAQIEALAEFMRAQKIDRKLRDFDFEGASKIYNGRGFRRNRHHIKWSSAYARALGLHASCQLGGAGEEVRRLQEALRARGATITVDGAFGPLTGQALVDFQRQFQFAHPLIGSFA
ncbi:MAG: N-acetylmuramidase domain-containing protein [Pseudomonadota bacterium]